LLTVSYKAFKVAVFCCFRIASSAFGGLAMTVTLDHSTPVREDDATNSESLIAGDKTIPKLGTFCIFVKTAA
jgi:hypothetical protein